MKPGATAAHLGTPYWQDSSSQARYPALDRSLTVDVAIIGGGITGLTTAYLLKRAGRTVAVIDRGRCGGVDTSHTTAHVTCVTDSDLSELVDDFGKDHAQAAWDAGLAAIAEIDTIVTGNAIDCHWARVPGYKFAALTADAEKARARLQREASLASELGFDAQLFDAVPFFDRPGVEFGGQARMHPGKYLAGLAALVNGGGSHVFERTESDAVTDGPLAVKARGYTITCDYVVMATHTPLAGKTNIGSATLLQTKLYLYSTYVIGGRVPKGSIPDALYWDTADPYHYLRLDPHRDFDYVIFGGEDHKTGQSSDTEACYHALETSLLRVIPRIDITHRWSGQVVETNDGLPFIGETSSRQFAATGFAGNGTTFGTVAAMMACDAALGLRNPWEGLFDAARTKVRGGTWDYLKENTDYPYYMLRGRLHSPEARTLRELRRGEGKIVEIEGERLAAWRNDSGAVTLLSPVCTHMGCIVGWNTAESTWDCPCHGSRFRPSGDVLSGPAESPLEKRPMPPKA